MPNLTWSLRPEINSVSRQIHRIIKTISGSNKQQILRSAADRFVQMAKSTFGSSGNTTFRGNTWPRYSKPYSKKVGSSVPSLLRTGALRNSIRSRSQGNSVVVYSDNPLAAVHMFGSPTRNIPARRFFPMDQNWILKYNAYRVLTKDISNQFNANSGGALPKISIGSMSGF
jgi:phage gpG-like protein